MNPRLLFYLLQYLESVAVAILLLALIVLVARWVIRHYAPPDIPNDDGESL